MSQLVVTLPDGKRFVFQEHGGLDRKWQLQVMEELIEKRQGEPSQR